MQIKKFVAKTASEAMLQVKKELGEDAIILQTKKVKPSGLFSFMKKEHVEILAAVEVREKPLKRKETPLKTSMVDTDIYKNSYQSEKFKSYLNNVKDQDEKPDETKILSSKINSKPIEKDTISKDIDEIKMVINHLNAKFSDAFKSEEDEEAEKSKNDSIKFLKDRGISQELALQIVDKSISSQGEASVEIMSKVLEEKFNEYKIEGRSSFNKKYNVFVGPTGVGKTTTLAKIASSLSIKENKRIGFLTLDTYRISAVEQLKTYAEILNCPLEVAYDKNDIKDSLQRLDTRDTIFIDTAGRSHKNKKHMAELKDMLSTIEDKEVFLVIGANFNKEDISEILSNYSFIENYHLIVTKLDETSRLGLIFDIMNDAGKSISYTTFGQNVPDDIEIFDLKGFINEFLREN